MDRAAEEIRELRIAIDANDVGRVRHLMTRNPALHRAPIGYGNDGPLTWVAECRVPWAPPGPERLAMARWMIENGSDVNQGSGGPLMRAALNGHRIPMMELLVAHGADVNAWWHGTYPVIFAPCESVDPEALAWLLQHGADPACTGHGFAVHGHSYEGSALDYLIEGYVRSLSEWRACLELLIAAGAPTRYHDTAVLAVLRGQHHALTAMLTADPGLVHRRFPELHCGQTGGRSLLLNGATLLHAAAEFGDAPAVNLLLEHGADVNALAAVSESGIGGQTPLFHAASQFGGDGFPIVEILLARGADPSIRARIPGGYERPGEVFEGNALEYARLFGNGIRTVAALEKALSFG